MAIFHVSTNTPSKAELLADWLPRQPWVPAMDGDAKGRDGAVEMVGSFHLDDPEGRVGMETHLVRVAGTLLQVPLTYRDAPLEGAEAALVGQMEHSVLGTRWVYDAVRDDRFVMVLAGVVLTGQGQALGMAMFEERWYVAPDLVSLQGGGWTHGPAGVDGFAIESASADEAVLRNDRFDLTVYRRPLSKARPVIGLTATWGEEAGESDPVLLAEITDRQHPSERLPKTD